MAILSIALGLLWLAGDNEQSVHGVSDDAPYIDAVMGTGPDADSVEADRVTTDMARDAELLGGATRTDMAPVAALPNAAARCSTPPVNGTIMDGAFPAGDHLSRLTVENGSGSPAFVKIIDPAQGLIRVMYLAKGGTGAIENIPNGTYDVKFAFGGWLLADCQTLTGTERTMEFEDATPMQATRTVTETPTEFGTNVRTHWTSSDVTVTLFTVPDGKARTQKITLKDFNAD